VLELKEQFRRVERLQRKSPGTGISYAQKPHHIWGEDPRSTFLP
jgi:hypothetical protein